MISVIILTCNRKKDILEAIESVRGSRGPEREIIVIDNGSTDGTTEELSGQSDLRVIRFEKGTGLARSRNAGIDAAGGEIAAFTDDDCVVADDWLERIANDLESSDAVGGVVKLRGKVNKPWWWNNELNWMPGLSVPGIYGPGAGVLYLPQSANMAYRIGVLKKLRFREGVGGIWLKNMTREDSDLWTRTCKGGYSAMIDTNLIVFHKVHQRRFTLRFCIRRAFSDGFAAYYREKGDTIWRVKLKLVLLEPFRIIVRKLKGSDGSRVHELFWIIRESGFLYARVIGKSRNKSN